MENEAGVEAYFSEREKLEQEAADLIEALQGGKITKKEFGHIYADKQLANNPVTPSKETNLAKNTKEYPDEHLNPIRKEMLQNHESQLTDAEYLQEIADNPKLRNLLVKGERNLRKLLGDNYDAPEMQQKVATSLREYVKDILEFGSVDALTGLPNRLGFERDASRLFRMAQSLGLLSVQINLDLDGFKDVNDNKGHKAGDDVLREFAAKLKEALRDSDAVARMGGDEFKILAVGPEIIAFLISQRILSIAPTASPFNDAPVSATLGISFSKPGDSLDDLDDRAEHALQWAKVDGKKRIGVGLDDDQFHAPPEERPAYSENVHYYPMSKGPAPKRPGRQ